MFVWMQCFILCLKFSIVKLVLFLPYQSYCAGNASLYHFELIFTSDQRICPLVKLLLRVYQLLFTVIDHHTKRCTVKHWDLKGSLVYVGIHK